MTKLPVNNNNLMINNTLRQLDIFSNQFHLKIDGHDNFKTTSGGIVSIISIALLSFTIMMLGKDFYMRTSPVMYYEDHPHNMIQDIYKEISTSTISFGTLPLLIGVNELDLEYSGYTLAFSYFLELQTSQNLVKSPMKKCENINSEKDQNSENLTFYCVRYEDLFENSLSDSLSFKFSLVRDSSINATKKLQTAIMIKAPIVFNSKDNYNYPLYEQYQNLFYFIDERYNSQKVRLSSKIQYFILFDDKGWIHESKQIITKFDYGNLISQPPLSDEPFSLTISLYPTSRILRRHFVKITEFFSIVGGFTKLIILFSNWVNYAIKSFSFDMHFVGHIKSITKSKVTSNNTKIHLNESEHFTYIDYLKAILFGWIKKLNTFNKETFNQKSIKLQKRLEQSRYVLSIDYILSKINEYETLKPLYFSDEQRLALEAIGNNFSSLFDEPQLFRSANKVSDQNKVLVNYFSSNLFNSYEEKLDTFLFNKLSSESKQLVLDSYYEKNRMLGIKQGETAEKLSM